MQYQTYLAALGLTATSLLSLTASPALAVAHIPSQISFLNAQTLEYGTEDQIGTGPYAADPKTGATLFGLGSGDTTQGTQSAGHTEFVPTAAPGDFPGTDSIHVGSSFTTQAHDGYSYQFLTTGNGVQGPDVFSLDYNSLLPNGQTLETLTLGIAADDFQAPKYGQPFSATINGVFSPGLSDKLNNLTLTDPSDLFFTFGVDPALLTGDNVLKVSIDEGGDGGDGYAIDFLTIGVTSSLPSPAAVPEASPAVSLGLTLALGVGSALIARKRKATAATG